MCLYLLMASWICCSTHLTRTPGYTVQTDLLKPQLNLAHKDNYVRVLLQNASGSGSINSTCTANIQ